MQQRAASQPQAQAQELTAGYIAGDNNNEIHASHLLLLTLDAVLPTSQSLFFALGVRLCSKKITLERFSSLLNVTFGYLCV